MRIAHSLLLDVSDLTKEGCFRTKGRVEGAYSWGERNAVRFLAVSSGTESYLKLDYTSTSLRTGESQRLSYQIDVVAKPSNLGKGEV